MKWPGALSYENFPDFTQTLKLHIFFSGKLSTPSIQVKTFEDVPGPPSNVSFPDVSFTTARVIWDVPSEPNGEFKAFKIFTRESVN